MYAPPPWLIVLGASLTGVAVANVPRWLALGLAMVIAASGCSSQGTVAYQSAPPSATAGSWTFDADAPGSVPAGAEIFSGSWVVRAEGDAPSKPNALCQIGNAEFPAIVLGPVVYGDVTVTLRFKPISGKTDQAAGIIARVQDRDDYYILRANALESNVNLYKYAGGRRSGIKDGSAKVAAGQWQELRLEVAGDRLRGFFNGQLVVEATDGTYKAGRVGLWTKADSVTCFDDVVVTPGSSTRTTATPAAATPSDDRTVVVQLGEHFFDPSSITVNAGTTVIWRNNGQQTHDVHARDGSFSSPPLDPGNTFSHTFTKPGHYPYYCIPHEGDGMVGEVEVR